MTDENDHDTWPKLPKLDELKLFLAGTRGEPGSFLGDGSLKILDRTKDRVWLAGVFKAPGRRIQVNGPAGGIPISSLPQANPGGAPKREKERMAQCLAWAYVRQKMRTHTAADMEVMRMFGRANL